MVDVGKLPTKGPNPWTARDIRPVLHHPDIWYILGWWVAEGCLCGTGRTQIALGLGFKDFEREWAQPLFAMIKFRTGREVKYWWSNSYRFHHKQFVNLCRMFKEGSANRLIPKWLFEMSNDVRKAFLLGYIRGDGCIELINVRVFSVSHQLLLGIQKLIKDFGFSTGKVRLKHKAYKAVIKGVPCNAKDIYLLNFSPKVYKFLEEVESKLSFGGDKNEYSRSNS